MLNIFTGVGRLTKDPELKGTQGNNPYVNFAVAFDSPTTDEEGERNTTFLDAVAFGQRAELIAKSLHKGSKVALSGSLNQRDFLRADGSKGRVYEIFVNTIEFLDPKPQVNEDYNKQDVQETIEVVEAVQQAEAKFDPYTGKPLTKPAKKK